MTHILIVEDEKIIRDILGEYMLKSGFQVSFLDRGDTVIPFIKKNPVNLVLLDIMLPGADGMDVCREIRSFSNVPVIMITAKVEELDRIVGLELGADDYICKPFSPREVVARVKAVLRRQNSPVSHKIIVSGPVEINEDTREVKISGHSIYLTPIEFSLFKIMIANPNRVFSRTDLINKAQGYDFEGYERTVDVHIKNLRKKIATVMPGKEIIMSVYGIGYKYNPVFE